MNETAKCTTCGNANEVKVSTGHNKPENKGRKYFSCTNCQKFQWVETTATPSTSNSPSPQAFTQSLGLEEKPDWDAIAKGKVRHGVVVAIIEHGGLEALEGQTAKINKVVNYIMLGRVDDHDGEELE